MLLDTFVLQCYPEFKGISMDSPIDSKRFNLQTLSPQDTLKTLQNDVQRGLFEPPYSLPPKYFYDDLGSKLFDQICDTQDYYPTRTELVLLQEYASEIINTSLPQVCVELGAGTSKKTEVLLSAISSSLNAKEFEYISIDVCEEVLVQSANRLLRLYENILVHCIVGEYKPAIKALPEYKSPVLYTFIGSSIGNFTEHESIQLLSQVAKKMHEEDYFLIGMDRVKDIKVLERAYDDSEGITSKFNLNVLNVLNENLGADFNLNNFLHHAIYNESEQQIEMYLVSKVEQQVNCSKLNKTIRFIKGEKILTEISRKYTKSTIQSLLNKSGLIEVMHFEPANEYFSLVLAKSVC